jgi:hypothetical protein
VEWGSYRLVFYRGGHGIGRDPGPTPSIVSLKVEFHIGIDKGSANRSELKAVPDPENYTGTAIPGSGETCRIMTIPFVGLKTVAANQQTMFRIRVGRSTGSKLLTSKNGRRLRSNTGVTWPGTVCGPEGPFYAVQEQPPGPGPGY